MWCSEIPSESGFYWFYGVLCGDTRYEPYLEMVKITCVGKTRTIVAHNEFIYEPIGVWGQRIPEPELPKNMLERIDDSDNK